MLQAVIYTHELSSESSTKTLQVRAQQEHPQLPTFSISPHLSSYVLFSFSTALSLAVSSWICFSYSRSLSCSTICHSVRRMHQHVQRLTTSAPLAERVFVDTAPLGVSPGGSPP